MDIVFVSSKPFMNYMVAFITHFNSGSNSLVLKARGRVVSRAVDIVELLKWSFVKGLKVHDISIGTE